MADEKIDFKKLQGNSYIIANSLLTLKFYPRYPRPGYS